MDPSKEQLIRVADAALSDLLDRNGIGEQLGQLKYDDPQLYEEIQLSVGKLAWDAVVVEVKP